MSASNQEALKLKQWGPSQQPFGHIDCNTRFRGLRIQGLQALGVI